MRLAWFSPLPPDRSGIAAYSADVLPLLARRHDIDAYVETAPAGSAPGAAGWRPPPTGDERTHAGRIRILGAHDFPWRRLARAYDLVVYQLGNDVCHDYMWPYMVRNAGLLVLHDAQLHQARAKGLIWRHRRADTYRAEFAYSHPDAPASIADLVVAGFGGTLYHLWPMLRVPIEAARLVAVHNERLGADLRERFPAAAFTTIRMGVPDLSATPAAAPSEVRARHGLAPDAVVFAAYGRATPEKRISPVVQALAGIAPDVPGARLLLVGDTVDYYDVLAEARALNVADRVTVTGYVPDDRLAEYLAVADACVCLRWPTSRETSASWLRCVAAGKPTIVTDLAHTADVPCLDPRSMRILQARPAGGSGPEPMAMAVDLVDEVNTLRLSLRRLAQDADLRARLGRAARAYWSRQATPDVMAADYERALAAAASAPVPGHEAWPGHLVADGTSRAREIAASIGVDLAWLAS